MRYRLLAFAQLASCLHLLGHLLRLYFTCLCMCKNNISASVQGLQQAELLLTFAWFLHGCPDQVYLGTRAHITNCASAQRRNSLLCKCHLCRANQCTAPTDTNTQAKRQQCRLFERFTCTHTQTLLKLAEGPQLWHAHNLFWSLQYLCFRQ